jgi:hypothetical protein
MLGFDGWTVLIDFQPSPGFERVRALAQRQPSYSEWVEENGRQYLRVTFSKGEMEGFNRLAVAAASLSRKHVFLNGMEIHWPAGGGSPTRHPQARHPAAADRPRVKGPLAGSSK